MILGLRLVTQKMTSRKKKISAKNIFMKRNYFSEKKLFSVVWIYNKKIFLIIGIKRLWIKIYVRWMHITFINLKLFFIFKKKKE